MKLHQGKGMLTLCLGQSVLDPASLLTKSLCSAQTAQLYIFLPDTKMVTQNHTNYNLASKRLLLN